MLEWDPQKRLNWNQVREWLQSDQLDESLILSASKQMFKASQSFQPQQKELQIKAFAELEFTKTRFLVSLFKELFDQLLNKLINFTFWKEKEWVPLMVYLMEKLEVTELFVDRSTFAKYLNAASKGVGMTEFEVTNFVLKNESWLTNSLDPLI
jgi:hypothetical protein